MLLDAKKKLHINPPDYIQVFGNKVLNVDLYLFSFIFSKVKRRLEKKPPNRSTICTTPRFLMKKKGKAPIKGQKQAKGAKQEGEHGSQTTVQQQKGEKKTKGQRLNTQNETRRGGTEKKKAGSNSSGVKLKKCEKWLRAQVKHVGN